MYYSAVLRDIKDYIIWQLGYSVGVFSKSSGNHISTRLSCPDFLFLELGTSILNLNSDWICTVIKWVIITDLWQLYYYCRSQKVVIILKVF